MRRSCLYRVAAALVALCAIAVIAVVVSKRNNNEWAAYQAYEESLYVALTQNNFSEEFASPQDRAQLAADLSFLKKGTQEETVVALVLWINEHFFLDEVMSVRATELLDAKSAACEVHAFAVGALEALGIKARWIGGAKSSLGFGFVEAFADGRWRLFKLRDRDYLNLGTSAWELYKESEPSLNIRHFYRKPEQAVSSWRGPVYPVVFPFANIERHPHLETLFTTDRGVPIEKRRFDPYQYIYLWLPPVDDTWVEDESGPWILEREYIREPKRRERKVLDLGLIHFYTSEPRPGLPSPFEIRIVIP